MLKFIFGRPASGKTYTILEMLDELSKKGKESVLIVPEQFSFESEKAVLKKLGDSGSRRVSVMSFSRLCEEVGRNVGGIAGITLGDADKIIFMNKALQSVSGELKLWAKYTRSVSFAGTMLDTVGEFKINYVTSDNLRSAAQSTESLSLKNKLNDTALIYEAYDALLGEKFIDPADNLTKLYRSLEDFHYFDGKTVFIDSFKGFTGQQFKIINRILAQAENTYVSLTNDLTAVREYNVYSNIRAAAEKIEESARRYKVKVEEPIVLGESRYNSSCLSSLERMIALGTEQECLDDGAITVCKADSIFDEAEFAARTIRRLVRTEGYRYRDFVIIARDAERYEDAVAAACARNNISCFWDKRVPLSSFPVAVAISSAIETALRPSTEQILRFHKTGLGTLDYSEIPLLENYTALWNISGELWDKPWDMDVRGFVSDTDESEENVRELENINTIREKAFAPIKKFKADFDGNASQMASAIVKLLEECNSADALRKMCKTYEHQNSQFSSDVIKQSYDLYMSLLDSIVRCFGERNISKREFYESLTVAVSLGTVGIIPQMLDEVTFGSADRIRPSRPKVAFILGANQGVFPKDISNTGIFAASERKTLIELGLEISDRSIFAAVDENFLVYSNLCCSSDKLFVSYCEHSVSGEVCEPSAFVSLLTGKLPCNKVCEPEKCISENNAPETLEGAYTEYCRRVRTSGDDAATIKTCLTDTNTQKRIKFIDYCMSSSVKSISEETAQKLFGNNIKMSATKFDTYHRCRFSFFCRYGLNTKKLQPAEFDVLQRGTMVHYVLERIISEYKKEISTFSRDKLDCLTDTYITEYLDGVTGYRSIETARSRFLISKISRALKDVVYHIAEEFAQSDFEPVGCEIKIGNGGDIPLLALPFDSGNILINGSIDRVDSYNGYIRIVDYKTGSKSFKLPDILFGLNLQMLIYLYAVIRAGGHPDDKAAGILYMPSKRDLNDSGMAMNGLIQSDSELVTAMEKNNAGEFIPKLKTLKDGSISKLNNSFISAEDFSSIFDYIEKLMRETGNKIVSGDISVNPVDGRESPACKYCDYGAVCGIEDEPCLRVPNLKNDEVIQKIKEVSTDGI